LEDNSMTTLLRSALVAALALCATAAFAQYKYIDANGRTVYSDQPPPPGARLVGKPGSVSGGISPASDLPYALQGPAKAFPVTLFTAANCEPCNSGRALLNSRGVPYQEKTVNSAEDQNVLKTATGSTNVPVLVVGSSKQLGFQPDQWNSSLDFAGYPKSNNLPRTFKNPEAQAAAGKPAEPAKGAAPAGAPAAGTQTAQAGDAKGAADAKGADGKAAEAKDAPTAAQAPAAAPAAQRPGWFKGF
jgi:glutaredoxin